jgi:hypothetical protein
MKFCKEFLYICRREGIPDDGNQRKGMAAVEEFPQLARKKLKSLAMRIPTTGSKRRN